MARAVAFVLLFAVTNASLVLLLFPTTLRTLVVILICGTGNAIMIAILFVPAIGWLANGRTSLPREEPWRVALTFDDGPTPDVTPRVLDVLRDKGVPATFFVVGRQVEANPDLARRVCREGHTIGNHSYSHPPLFCFLTPPRLRRELARGQDSILRVTGTVASLFRSPVGLRHPLLSPVLERAGLEFVLWSIRSFDTWPQSVESLRRRILGRVRPGDIVLLHDRPGRGAAAMIEALPGIIDDLRAQGYLLVRL
jgi:peptidoglycan/xylan/chitin deacetylase (PgdA/CDA1 family)